MRDAFTRNRDFRIPTPHFRRHVYHARHGAVEAARLESPLHLLVAIILLFASSSLLAQAYGEPDRGEPGDAMIQAALADAANRMDATFSEDLRSKEDWEKARPRYQAEYLYMLGLSPLPEKTPLAATVTGSIDRGDFRVEKLHYQSVPGLYVTANLYRPGVTKPGEKLPAVLYVCGHSGMGRNGNKTAYQSQGIWFARHGYVCLVLDTLQLGEIAGVHHGTYREGRWWWHSRGYTSAGVECWNGVRGVDYLRSRSDVDPERIAVTGISGGGAATFWIAAADERVAAAVPVSGMADLSSYVSHRVINGHCDCMFLHNTFEWPWTRIAALVAPRPLCFINSHEDPIFPMDANERVIEKLERVYALYGAGDRVDAVVSLGGHAYRKDIRQAGYRFINTQLRGDSREVTDSEVDLVDGSGEKATCPIAPEELRVFPEDSDFPPDARNATIDRSFVPRAEVELPKEGAYAAWKAGLVAELRRVVFRSLGMTVPAAKEVARVDGRYGRRLLLETEPGIRIPLVEARRGEVSARKGGRILLWVLGPEDQPTSAEGAVSEGETQVPSWMEGIPRADDRLCLVWPRGIGETRWTRKDPPNTVERSLVLLGTTADTGRVRDIIAVARHLAESERVDSGGGKNGGTDGGTGAGGDGGTELCLVGRGAQGVLAAYAALLAEDIKGAMLFELPGSHMDSTAPRFLNVLRVCDIPEVLGMLAPRRLVLRSTVTETCARVKAIYEAAGAAAAITILPAVLGGSTDLPSAKPSVE